jgi:hypothetical protein
VLGATLKALETDSLDHLVKLRLAVRNWRFGSGGETRTPDLGVMKPAT